MQEELDKAKVSLQLVLDLIRNGEVHHDPDWSWDLEVICLEHDIDVYEYAIKHGHTDFNVACEEYYQSVLNDD